MTPEEALRHAAEYTSAWAVDGFSASQYLVSVGTRIKDRKERHEFLKAVGDKTDSEWQKVFEDLLQEAG